MRLALVANPRSGTAPEPQRLAALLGAGGAEVSITSIQELKADEEGGLDPGSLAAAARALSCDGGAPDRIVVAGGDGSIGLAALVAAEMGVALAVVAVGTANDFARALGLPMDLEQACALARDPRAGTRHAELALAGERPFVNAAATGLSVVAAREAHPHKSRFGPLAYAVGALKAAGTASTLHCRVLCDGGECFEGRAWQVVVGATGAFGGGSEIGGTTHEDGLLDVAIVPAGSRIGLARRAWGMRSGRLTRQFDVAHHRGATIEVHVEDHSAAFNVDGEICRCEPAHFSLQPGGFEVVVA
ncbi:MAG: diacylglycerol kinase family protein [Solirubrobacteraceae bacterium]